MTSPLTVLWPKVVPPDIEEIRFSYDFCRRLSKQLCEKAGPRCSWVEYRRDQAIEELLSWIVGDMVLVVTESEIVLSPSAVHGLTRCLETGYRVCGPVYNQTTFSHQRAALPAPYADMESYLEIAAVLAEREKNKYVVADSLDPACFLCRVKVIREIPQQGFFSEVPGFIAKMRSNAMAVVRGALVHCGFTKAFETERTDLVRLVPEGVKRVLDVGCAMGGYGKALKQLRPEISLTGIELNPIMAESAVHHYDEVVRCPVEEAKLSGGFDLINCGDILEHLQDPWSTLRHLNSLLREGGYLVMSIPNAGHWSIVRQLLKGEFQYVPLGLLCIGHLRWFTESSIRNALEEAGFSLDVFERQQIPPTLRGQAFIRHMCAAGYGDENSLRTNEFVIRAFKR
jgi:SAM-dependent methyltransferase